MDVRCNHCKTENKVEDAKVGDLGTEVRCTDCGHLIMIRRPTPAVAPASDAKEGEYHIETALGRTHHLPDLAMLHRWIIERRVTREDRISQKDQAWRRVGDIEELLPFLDIADSAERVRRADTPSPRLLSPAEVASALQPPVQVNPAGVPAQPAYGEQSPTVDRTETQVSHLPDLKPGNLLKLGLTMLVAAVVAYAGIALHNYRSEPKVPVAAREPAPPAINPVAGSVAPAAAEPATVPVEANAKNEGSEPHGPVVQPIADSDKGASAPPPPKTAIAGESPPAPKVRVKAAAVNRRKAAQASGPKPNTPQALAADGYVALSHRRFPQAISLFKMALAGSPTNGTAQFGLAEAYRLYGQKAQALECYHRYVQILPRGPDAAAARTQIKILEGKAR